MKSLRLMFFVLFATLSIWAAREEHVSAISVESVHIEVDADVLSYESDFTYTIVHDRLLVQATALAKALDAQLSYNQTTGVILLQKGNKHINLKLGDHTARINGKQQTFEAAPMLYYQDVLVPLRLVSETFGVKVEWNRQYRAAVLSTKGTSTAVINNKLLPLAAKGRLATIRYPLSTTRTAIEQEWGKPFDSYYYEGGQFFAYARCNCSVLYDEQNRSSMYELFSSQIGYARTADVRRSLGKPFFEDESQTHSEYVLSYPAGTYMLTIFATFKEGAITSIQYGKRRSFDSDA